MVVAIGGGSVLDAAKAFAGLLPHGNSVMDHLEGVGKNVPYRGPSTPFIAVPTTAGTGSEVTRAAVITDSLRGVKMVVKDEAVRPDLAVCDPLLSVSMPPSVTAATGMDALAHAIEVTISRETQPMSELFGLEAIRRIHRSQSEIPLGENNIDFFLKEDKN